MISLQPNITNKSHTTFNGRHHPRQFSSMMNYIYKKAVNNSDLFESTSSIVLTTTMKGDNLVSGIAHFLDGKYTSLVMEEGAEHLKSKFMSTVLEKYIDKISSVKTKNKLKREKR